jgi:trans-aconitate 2-methyltransferase
MLLWVDAMHKWNPEAYEKSSSEQKKWAEEVISKIQIKGNEQVLDIGCGDGKITAHIASLVPEGSVVGIDNSAEMISFAQSKFPQSSWPNLSFQYGDASDLRYEDEFDLVVSFACLHWVLDHKPVLEGIKRSLKSNGRLFIQFGGRGNAGDVLEVVNEKISEDRWARYFEDFTFPYGFFGPEEYEEWLSRVGLRAIRVELIPKEMVQHGIEGLASWVESTWLPYIERVPDGLRHDFIREIAERLCVNLSFGQRWAGSCKNGKARSGGRKRSILNNADLSAILKRWLITCFCCTRYSRPVLNKYKFLEYGTAHAD